MPEEITVKTPIKVRPSDADRWTVCLASPAMTAAVQGTIPEVEQAYTGEGKDAHDLAAMALTLGDEVYDDAPYEMARFVKEYTDFVRKHQKAMPKGSDMLVESQIPVYYAPDRVGYIDVALIRSDGTHVYIGDYKHGEGISVQALCNKQLAIYARSFIEAYSDVYGLDENTQITLFIYQPRISHEEALRKWELTVGELYDWTEKEVTVHAEAILDKPLEQMCNPSDNTCRFCPGEVKCGARAEQLLGPVALDDGPATPLAIVKPKLELRDVTTLTVDEITAVLKYGGGFNKWLEKVKAYAVQVMELGQEYEGFKLVHTRPQRKWTDEDKVIEFLMTMFPKKDIAPSKLISPAKAEEFMSARRTTQAKWDQYKSMVVKPGGRPTLAKESDSRESIFKDEEQDPYEDLL